MHPALPCPTVGLEFVWYARDDLVALVTDRLRRARGHAASPELPAAAVTLLATVAAAIEGRIP